MFALLLAVATPGVEVISLFYASQAVGQLAPFLLVAYLTTTLSADINNGKSLSTALDDYAKSLQGLAPQSGYKVVTK